MHPEGSVGISVLLGGLYHSPAVPSVGQATLVSGSTVLPGPAPGPRFSLVQSRGCLPGGQLLEPMACRSGSVPSRSLHGEPRSGTTLANHCLHLCPFHSLPSAVQGPPFPVSPQQSQGLSALLRVCVWDSLVRGRQGEIKRWGLALWPWDWSPGSLGVLVSSDCHHGAVS